MGNCPSCESQTVVITAVDGINEDEAPHIKIIRIKDEDRFIVQEVLESPPVRDTEDTALDSTDNSKENGQVVESDDLETPSTNNESKPDDVPASDDIFEPTTEPPKAESPSNAENINESNENPRFGVISKPIKINDEKLPVYPKAPDDEQLIKAALEKNDFLNKVITGKVLDTVVAAMYNKEIAPREKIIKQGEDGSHMYVSAKGKYQIIVNGKVNLEFGDARVFGELAILYKSKRLATVKALTEGRVWVLDRDVYQKIMIKENIVEETEIMEFLMNNQTLNVVGKGALQDVASLLKTEFFSPGTVIVKQGDKGQKFYIIRAGTVTITKDGVHQGICKKGDCFGELALLKEDCRQATVTANSPGVECLTLRRKEFIDHFGEIGDRFKYISTDRPKSSIRETPAEFEDVELCDLRIITTLGVGGFGRVELVQHMTKSNLVFALKYMKKIDIVAQQQQEHAQNEKNIQMRCRSPFIVRLFRTYKDPKYVFFLMEVCLGGDLWSLLRRQRSQRFEEKEAKFICGCVLEAFEYLHTRGIVYRDLKPENLMIAPNGYIKLTDFGFAKFLLGRSKTYTFAGTPDYVAPEIVLHKGHDKAVDYWAYGCFIFEMLTGRTPFSTDDSSHMKTYNKILSGIDNITFPTYVNLRARHIIEKLCRPVASERLGMQKGGIKDIKTHKWFQGFDWVRLAKNEIPPPFKPKLKNNLDTTHIDKFSKDNEVPPDDLSGWDSSF